VQSPVIFTVSALNREARQLLESHLSLLWVAGEISNLARPGSGHLYFSLKDQQAQIRCALFQRHALRLGFEPANGMQVTARGRVSLYEERGEYQLIVEHLAPAGEGALRLAFEQLKQRLFNEGLFDLSHKRALPRLPQRIGVITSPTGAALHDILSVLQRRFPAIPVRLYPVPVQGREAAPAIIAALQQANRRRDCEVLLLARGGGSLEDLQAFNDEGVARALFASVIPVVTGIGHEIDVSIADFVADQRAATPSAAAELVSPEVAAWYAQLQTREQQLQRQMQRRLDQLQQRLHHLSARLQSPRSGFNAQQQLTHLKTRLHQSGQQTLQTYRQRLSTLRVRLVQRQPGYLVQQRRSQADTLTTRLQQAMRRRLQQPHTQLARLTHTLNAVSPLATLQRGYSILSDANGQLLSQIADTTPGDLVQARLFDGELSCQVLSVRPFGVG